MIEQNKKEHNSRRIFVSSDKKNYYQIFHFTQDKDGSIYASWPNFSDTRWLFPFSDKDGNQKLNVVDFAEEGKLSIHGAGMGSFRSHDKPNIRPIIIKGNKLLDLGKSESGARHLLTAFMKEPLFLPNSPALNRQSDYLINSSEKMGPFIVIFFAVPKTIKGLKLSIMPAFNVDDIDIPPRGGFGIISLKYHDVIWYVYQTHNMEKWPKKYHISFYDGFFVPVIIGTKPGKFRLEFRKPIYELKNNEFTIKF